MFGNVHVRAIKVSLLKDVDVGKGGLTETWSQSGALVLTSFPLPRETPFHQSIYLSIYSLPFVYYLEWISNIFNQKIFANSVISVHEATRSCLCSSDRLSIWHVPGYYRKEIYAHTHPYVTCFQPLRYIKKKIKILVYNDVHKEVTQVRKRRKN